MTKPTTKPKPEPADDVDVPLALDQFGRPAGDHTQPEPTAKQLAAAGLDPSLALPEQ